MPLLSYIIATKSSLISLDQIKKQQKIYFCKTYHARFWPINHSFKYPIIFVGVDLDLLEQEKYKKVGKRLYEIGYNNSSILLNINDDDYLGEINAGDHNLKNPYLQRPKKQIKSIKEKLLWHINQHNIPVDDLCRFELVTMPRFLGYAFNPVSFHYCYNKSNRLQVIVLEVNNTFGEKHLYVYDMSFTMKRSFHVSPFNDRLGIYKAFCKDPKSGYLDVRIVMYADPSISDHKHLPSEDNIPIKSQFKKKMVATASGPSYALTMNSLLYAIMTYPFEIFLTFPRILKEAYKLHYNKTLGVYHRPIPVDGTVVKLEPNSIDLYAQKIITRYLGHLVDNLDNSFGSTRITINLPDKNKSPIIIRPSNSLSTMILPYSNHIIINLHNYSFFTNFLINQNIYRALLIGYFEKAWDCNELEWLLNVIFNNKSFEEKEPLHRDHKIRLSNFENRISKLRRWYWTKLFKDPVSSGERAKKEFDQLLQNMWPPTGVEEDFIATIVQNNVCFDIRLNATIIPHERVSVALRDLLAINNEGSIIALFCYTHLYMLSPITYPLSTTISKITPIIESKLHLLPFPPRYLPYENKEPLKHPIDRFVYSSHLFTNQDQLKYTWMMLLMVLGYKSDAGLWQMFTGFVEGPRGNPYFAEKWLWEGIVDLLKRYERNEEGEEEEQWVECDSDVESVKSINIKSSNIKNEYSTEKNIFDGWELVYERTNSYDNLQRVKSISTPNLPPPSSSPNISKPKQLINHNPVIEEDRQHRLWLFIKTFREVMLLRNDLK
ncbi:13565_t:CDS:2 [Funneliformis geosporum]|uniref:241_t:CDS:1 n=1 Tax=Funneliformis geosporum TaxID=1117311 RepID=A0A9W4WLZ2_9GLOM|nr:13565_t:CDS:2 [Funneliformis geosporum]CAI2163801.1 241_t:CDS:2 [Funneliformis geosporum]